ncbi:MAG: DNA repair protein RecO [Candidatus Aminicenantes bacterium RBG_19FT_COMBO_58_17]|jgi:DNA repair protein RecO (recombination protein O)|nr:MAG: DNA repair protein RecO [Candidatus Aminicenantes bacterium RBG_19FT_COMBO_58_17]HCS48599.1 DNA repair protein RecO [Candidatus Aminicenantes bacterium]
MPLDQTEAIVLRSFNIGDQDKVVVFFSRDKGLLRGVAKGARKFGNRFGSSLEPMSLVKVFYYEKEHKDLVTVSQAELIESFFEVHGDFRSACTLGYFAELVEEFFPSRAKEDLVFRLLFSVLSAIKQKGDLGILSRYFEAWFLQINGLLPDFRRCRKCRKRLTEGGWLSPRMDGVYCGVCAPLKKEEVPAEFVHFLGWVRKNAPPIEGGPACSAGQLEDIGRTLQSIIVYHLEREPKSLHFLK